MITSGVTRPADVADDDGVAEAEAEEVRGIDAGITAGDHEQTQLGKHDGSLVRAFGGEDAVAVERGTHVGGHFNSVIGLHG